MTDRQLESDPVFYCFSCRREGKTQPLNSEERITLCEKCGLKFCHYCGMVDESSMVFYCNSCWRDTAKWLSSEERYDEAIAIFEKLQDFDLISEVNSLRDPKRTSAASRIRFERDYTQNGGVAIGCTYVLGKFIPDIELLSLSPEELSLKFGEELFVPLESMRMTLVTLPRGIYEYDARDRSVKTAGNRPVQSERRYIVFKRIPFSNGSQGDLATVLDGLTVPDWELRRMGKKTAVNAFGWETITILVKIMKSTSKRKGFFIMDLSTGTVISLNRKI